MAPTPDTTTEAARQLSQAERALALGDFDAAKRHAELAIDSDPLVAGVDEILAVSDVLLAAKHRINNHPNYYSVLLLPSPPSAAASAVDSAAISRSYRRLTLLLNPSQNPNPKSQAAAGLVAEAYAVLSDPSKKALFDAELAKGGKGKEDGAEEEAEFDPFWTACISCFRVHLYDREYLNSSIRCSTCRRPFSAVELSMPPTIVPGTDSYYCSWGFYPLGYPGGPKFKCPEGVGVENPGFGKEWNAFFQFVDEPKSKEVGKDDTETAKTESGTFKGSKRRKAVVRRNLSGGLKKPNVGGERRGVDTAAATNVGVADPGRLGPHASGVSVINMAEEMVEVGGIDVNFATGRVSMNSQVGGSSMGGGVGGHVGVMPFQVAMDAAGDEILNNYHNIPFDIRLRMMP